MLYIVVAGPYIIVRLLFTFIDTTCLQTVPGQLCSRSAQTSFGRRPCLNSYHAGHIFFMFYTCPVYHLFEQRRSRDSGFHLQLSDNEPNESRRYERTEGARSMEENLYAISLGFIPFVFRVLMSQSKAIERYREPWKGRTPRVSHT